MFIHSVNLNEEDVELIRSNIKKLSNYSEEEAFIDVKKNPFDIAKQKRLSTSFFSTRQKKRFCLFGRVVFILNVPIENIMYVGFDSKYEKLN